MNATATKIAIAKTEAERLAAEWVGRMVYGSADHRLNDSGKNPRPVESIHYSVEYEKFVAFSGEHHTANSAKALARRLHHLAV